MTIAAVVQARMDSSRLPGKVLLQLGDRSMLEHLLTAVSRVPVLDSCIVATTTKPVDDAIAQCAGRSGVPIFRGSEDDVLDRIYSAARHIDADVVVRLTADCPLLDSNLLQQAVTAFQQGEWDYYTLSQYPIGIGEVEVMSMFALAKAARQAGNASQREHVTPYIYEHPNLFACHFQFAPAELNRPNYRLCLDEGADLALIHEVFRRLGGTGNVARIVKLLDAHPGLVAINRHVSQRAPHLSGASCL